MHACARRGRSSAARSTRTPGAATPREPDGQPLLELGEPQLQTVEPTLEADDVRLAEHRDIERVRRLVDQRRPGSSSGSP